MNVLIGIHFSMKKIWNKQKIKQPGIFPKLFFNLSLTLYQKAIFISSCVLVQVKTMVRVTQTKFSHSPMIPASEK